MEDTSSPADALTEAELRRRTYPFPPVSTTVGVSGRVTRQQFARGAAFAMAALVAAGWLWPVF